MSNDNREDFDIDNPNAGVPDAPQPKPKQPENLPDWAKITSSIVEETEDAGEIFDAPARTEYVPPKKGFGAPAAELSEDELFLADEEPVAKIPAPAVQEEKYEDEDGYEEPYRAPVESRLASRTVPDYVEEEEGNSEAVEEEQEVFSNSKKGLFKKIPDAKAKKPRSVKSAKSIRKAVSAGVMGKESDIMAPRGRMAGSRWKLIGLRTAVWGTLGLIMFTGTLTIFGPKGPSISALTQQVLLNLNRNNFPIESGQHLASRFIKEYLNMNLENVSLRDDILRSYIIGSGTNESLVTSFIADRQLRVIGEPILAKPVELISDYHVVYTFAVQVFQPAVPETEDTPGKPATLPEWVYLAVPVSAAEDGSIGISGMPALVPQPKVAEAAENIVFAQDREARTSALPQIELFLKHWAASDSVSLKPYLVEGVSSSSAGAGLGETVEFVKVNRFTVEAFPNGYVQDPEVAPTCSAPDYAYPCRKAYVEVVWQYETFQVANTYRMVVLFDGQNWRVIDIRGAHFGPIGQ